MYYEFKSWKTSSFDDKIFIEQFADLSRDDVTLLSQIRWVFDSSKMGKAMVKTKVLEALKRNTGVLKAVGAIKANQLLSRTDLSDITEEDNAEIANEIINHLTIDENFNAIFK